MIDLLTLGSSVHRDDHRILFAKIKRIFTEIKTIYAEIERILLSHSNDHQILFAENRRIHTKMSFCLSVFLSFCLSVFLSFCLSVFLSVSLFLYLSLSLSLYFYLSSLNKHNFCLRLVKVLRQVHDDGSLELGAGDVDHHPPRLRKFLFLQRFFQLEVVDDDLHNFVVEQFSDYNFTNDRTLANLIDKNVRG